MYIRKFLTVLLTLNLVFCSGCAKIVPSSQGAAAGKAEESDSGSEQTASTAGNTEDTENAVGEETESIEENDNTQSTESDEEHNSVTPEQQLSNGPVSQPEEYPEIPEDQPGKIPESPNTEVGQQPEEPPKTEAPAENENGSAPKQLTYEEYLALDVFAQQDYYNTFPDMMSFLAWYNHAKAVYEAENPPQYADGDITLG